MSNQKALPTVEVLKETWNYHEDEDRKWRAFKNHFLHKHAEHVITAWKKSSFFFPNPFESKQWQMQNCKKKKSKSAFCTFFPWYWKNIFKGEEFGNQSDSLFIDYALIEPHSQYHVKIIRLHLTPLISNRGKKNSQKFKDFQILSLKAEKEVGACIYPLTDQEPTSPLCLYVLRLSETWRFRN